MDVSLYLHIPFCQRKCHYCDFNTYAGVEHLIPPYIAALTAEIRAWAPLLDGHRVSTVFFGGGTPSLLSVEQLGVVLDSCRATVPFASDAEITMEANPGSAERGNLPGYRAAGVNRISFGAQSFDAGELQWLGRIHQSDETARSVQLARDAGFERLNLDLIFGLPGQSQSRWEQNLARALEFGPDHLSLYALTVEEGTPLGAWVQEGRVPEPDPDVAADHYEAAQRILQAAGFRQYEISNWARPGQECRHNLTYWRNLPYVGFGAGAHSSFGGCRFADVRLPQEYIRRVGELAEAGNAEAGIRNQKRGATALPDVMLSPLRPGSGLTAAKHLGWGAPLSDQLSINAGQPEAPLDKLEERDADAWAQAIRQVSPVSEVTVVDAETDFFDTLTLGLRLDEGVRFDTLQARHGVDIKARYAEVIERYTTLELLRADAVSMRITPQGRFLANEVFVGFMTAD